MKNGKNTVWKTTLNAYDRYISFSFFAFHCTQREKDGERALLLTIESNVNSSRSILRLQKSCLSSVSHFLLTLQKAILLLLLISLSLLLLLLLYAELLRGLENISRFLEIGHFNFLNKIFYVHAIFKLNRQLCSYSRPAILQCVEPSQKNFVHLATWFICLYYSSTKQRKT